MITQKFKGDDVELKMEAAASNAFDACDAALDEFLADGYGSSPFLLMLYDEGRMPFSDRVPRDAFVEFMKEALERFPVTGTFETYLFILEKVFGEGSGVQFDVPAPGKLEMLVNASSSVPFDWIARELSGGGYVEHNMVDHEGNQLEFRGISGISSEAQLTRLLAELIPAGIWPDVALAFFEVYDFIAEFDDEIDSVIDHLGNQIVFIEVGA